MSSFAFMRNMRDTGKDVVYQLVCGLSECGKIFCICRYCYRGHKYCSNICRAIARRRQVDAARRRYNQSIDMKLEQRERKRRWRLRRAKTTVPDHGSPARRRMPPSGGRDCTNRRPVIRSAVIVVLKPGMEHVTGVHKCVVCGRAAIFVNPFRAVRRYHT